LNQPQTISRLVYEVEEALCERTQEVRVEVSADGARTYRQILVQEYNFSPRGATYQREEQRLKGAASFVKSWDELMAVIASKSAALAKAA
jgi:hypothetical protein